MKLRDLIAALENAEELGAAIQSAEEALAYLGNPHSLANQSPAKQEKFTRARRAIEEARRAHQEALDEELPGLLTREELIAAIEAATVYENVHVAGFKESWEDQTPESKNLVTIDPKALIEELTK
jgi:flagellar motility protein MotE (MotC chaperone)